MTNIDARLVYENSKNALRKAFPDVPQIAEICKLTQSTLRLEQPITAGNTLYTFPVLDNTNLYSSTEKRLLQQDSAVIYQLGLFVAKAATPATGAYPLFTHPNPIQFSTAGAATAMYAIYNGNLSIAVNNDILVPNWDLYKHLNVPQTQETAAANTPMDETRGAFDSFYPVEPNLVLIGSKNNVVQITLPSGGVTTIEPDSRLVLIMRCVLAQNSTVVS